VGTVLTVSVPAAEAESQLADLSDVDVLLWDGLDSRPDDADRIEMFVGRYDAPPPDREVLAALPNLRVVQLLSAGVEPWLDVVPEGVMLCNGRGVHGASTAELAVAGLLAVMRELPTFLALQAEHRWDKREADGLDGRRVLVLGAGDIGARVAAAVRAFDAESTLVARRPRQGVRTMDELGELLPEHDAVVLALPNTPQTTGLVDAEFLAALPDGAVVVNVARGPIVRTDALLAELTSRRLRAFLDVTDPEPLPADHPLWDAPNLLLTPHVGGGTRGWARRAYRLVREQVERLRDGEELANQVSAGY
jgi:phosphoglycerate dehydrogenase-like enzyme